MMRKPSLRYITIHCSATQASVNIGVCLIGGTDKALQAQDNFTLAQRKALFGLITQLQHQFEIKDEDVRGHNEWDSGKACPVMVIKN